MFGDKKGKKLRLGDRSIKGGTNKVNPKIVRYIGCKIPKSMILKLTIVIKLSSN